MNSKQKIGLLLIIFGVAASGALLGYMHHGEITETEMVFVKYNSLNVLGMTGWMEFEGPDGQIYCYATGDYTGLEPGDTVTVFTRYSSGQPNGQLIKIELKTGEDSLNSSKPITY